MAQDKTSNSGKNQKRKPGNPNIGKVGEKSRFKSRAELGGQLDPRINMKGRPKSQDQLRKLFQAIAGEIVEIEVGKGKKKQKLKMTRAEAIGVTMAQSPKLMEIFLAYGYGKPRADGGFVDGDAVHSEISIPGYLLGPQYNDVYRDVRAGAHTEYIFNGGRGSIKSSTVSLLFVERLVNNPSVHGLIARQVKDTLRDSVYAQIQWAINELGLTEKFKMTLSPMEMEYLPTGQKIYFRGADDPFKIKSIKPPFGYIGLLWFEELDQFRGAEAVRNIEQSVIRGGDKAWIFKSFNPPRTKANWANKYILIPKESQYKHFSNYLQVPAEWLGKIFLEEAEHLKQVNPDAYEHEYMGVANGHGGMVFQNLQLREITDKQIAQFDRILHGNDWGFSVDPFSYGKMHYDAARRILYIFDELYGTRMDNATTAEKLKPKLNGQQIIADSAEPKSIADWKKVGINVRAAEKGPDSVNYSMKWLQSLTAIVIDPVRCPHHAEEFANYEHEKDKDGEFISGYPDKNNHTIDDTRYATNLLWRR